MRKLLTGDCHRDNIFSQVDPTQFAEIDFEAEVAKALICLLPEYHCGVFAGAFRLEGARHIGDLALVHKSNSHWFVVEVELAGHSLEGHVLPQVRCFRYGEAENSCVTSLMRAFKGMDEAGARALLRFVPRYVLVVSNMPDEKWTTALRAADVQHLTVSVYEGTNGRRAYEMEGQLDVRLESLGFGRFSATDNSLRISKGCRLPVGETQIVDQFGNLSSWTVREDGGVIWIRKNHGPALLPHDSYVQVLRTFDGRVSIRPSAV